MKDSQSLLHMSTRATDETCFKNLPVHPKTALNKQKKKRMATAKRFALQANGKKP